MKTLIKKHAQKGLCLEEVPTPSPGLHDILIRVLRTSLCGTDLSIYQSGEESQSALSLPLIIGHEFVGEIVKTCPILQGQGYKTGQIVSGETHVTCGVCVPCVAGHRHQCLRGAYVGINRPGAFAEYIVLPASSVWAHPSTINLDIATLFEPLGNAVNAAMQFTLLGKAVLITGASAEGLMAGAVCRHAGARHVVVIDQSFQKLRLALSLGATHVINSDEDDIDDVKQGLGLHNGFDIGLEMSGNPAAYSVQFSHIKQQGEIAMVGVPNAPQLMDWRSVIFKQLTVKGVYGRAMPGTWQRMSELIESGLDLSPIITKRVHYTAFEEGFEALRRAVPGKVIMNWETE